MQFKERNISVEKTALHHADFAMWPRLPGWNNRAIPGCLVEALVLLELERETAGEFEDFCRTAQRIGFQARLFKSVND
jgi:hypothetical protein